MQSKIIIYAHVLVFGFSSCTCEQSKIEEKKVYSKSWNSLSITTLDGSKKEKIGIFVDDDSCLYYYRDMKDTLSPFEQSFFMSPTDRQYLFELFELAINERKPSEILVSDYQGSELLLEINPFFGNPTTSCKYQSIENWKDISITMKKIYELTFGRLNGRGRVSH